MSDAFNPLNLNEIYNAGPENLEVEGRWLWPFRSENQGETALTTMPSGNCSFWGIPFSLAASDTARRFVVVADIDSKDVTSTVAIPIRKKTLRLLFAHTCSSCNGEWATLEGAGESVGTYRFMFEDGSVVEQELRRRFEIHDTHVPWGHHPFVSRNCREFISVAVDDKKGPWGRTQTGTITENGSDLEAWWLFVWDNPHPEKIIEKIDLVASGPTAVALGAITLCDEAADPFVWAGRKEIAVDVGNDDEVPGLSMDRGVIARQEALFVPTEDYLTSEESGWGLGGQQIKNGGYAEIHGSPQGQLRVKTDSDDETIRWGSVLESGQVQQGNVRIEMVSPRGNQWVHVRVVDADTGKPVGTRVNFRSPHGAYIAPHGHQVDVNTAWFEDMGGDCKVRGTPYAYIDGTCQIDLPVGSVYVEAVRGFEYSPVRQKLEIKPGQRHLTLEMKRVIDMKERGYYSGDTHVHFLSAQSAHLEAAAEDLNVTHLLASQWGRLFTSWEEFTGGLAPTSSDENLIYVSQENRQHVLGHISLLGLKEMIAPMCTGGPNEDWIGGEIQVLMADWAEACKAQGGLVIMPHMPVPDFENAANIVMGHADAAEMCWVWQGEQIGQGERGYYRWLNVGQKLPIVGGTDKMSNDRILGGSRTYAKLAGDEEFTFDNWCQAVRRGTTFASTGAMIDIKVEGRGMGEEIHLPGNGGTIEIEAFAESVWPLTAIELIVNGIPGVRETAHESSTSIKLHHKFEVSKSCWVAARCWGPHLTDAGPVMAHSSPVYVDVGGRATFQPTDGQYLMTQMEGGITWAERIGVFRDEAIRSRLIALFREAQEELQRRKKHS